MNIIGIVSGKGGVGKTTTVTNLGVTLSSKFNRKTLIIDGNFDTPDLGLHLGMYSFQYNLQDVLKKEIPLKKAIYKHHSGADILPASLSYEDVDTDIRDLKGYLQDLDEYEYGLIDSPPGVGGEILPILEICDELLVVTNPEIPAITDCLRLIEISKRMNIPIRGIVLNMIRGEKFELSTAEVESVTDVPVVATIPEDSKVRESIALGNPVALNYPYSPSAIEFAKFGACLLDEEYSLGLFAKIVDWFRSKIRREAIEELPKEKVIEMPVPTEKVPSIKVEEKMPEEKMAIELPVTTEEVPSIEVEEKIPEIEAVKPAVEVPGVLDEEEILSLKSTLKRSKMAKEINESILDKLKKKYEDKEIKKPMYDRIKKRYERELKGCLKEIKKIENELTTKTT